jgi:F-type H+-transporting ATPase subunit delta
MSNRASASRYAKALLEVMIREGNPEQAEQEVASFADLFERHEELRKAMLNPAVPVTAKRTVMEQLVGRVKPSPPVGKLILLLAERDRLELLPDLLAAYRDRLMDHLQIVRAEVRTAVPLPEDRAAQLQQRLADVTGRRVTMSTSVDPSIIGGVVARIGSTVYDGSVATQLARIKSKLVEQA